MDDAIGFDEKEYPQALNRVPLLGHVHIHGNVIFLPHMMWIPTKAALKNLRITRKLEERKETGKHNAELEQCVDERTAMEKTETANRTKSACLANMSQELREGCSTMKRILALTTLALMFSLPAAAEPASVRKEEKPTVPLHVIYIPKLMANDGTGPFADLIHEIGRRAGLNIKIIVLPPQRQRMAFGKKQIDIIFPMVESSFDAETEYLRSSSFFDKRYFAFTKRGALCVKSMADMEKLTGKVGLTLGYSYPQVLLTAHRLTFDYAPTDDQNMSKVGLGRIAAFVVEEVSGLAALQHTKLEAAIQYDPQSPLFTEEVFFALQKKESLIPIRDAISRAIDEMRADGSLRKILGNLEPSGKRDSQRGRQACK